MRLAILDLTIHPMQSQLPNGIKLIVDADRRSLSNNQTVSI